MHSRSVMNLSKFISSLTVTFVSFNERSHHCNKNQQLTVCCVLFEWAWTWFLRFIFKCHPSYKAQTQTSRENKYFEFQSPKNKVNTIKCSFSLLILNPSSANHNNKIDWINRQWEYGLIIHKHNSLCTHIVVLSSFLAQYAQHYSVQMQERIGQVSWKK